MKIYNMLDHLNNGERYKYLRKNVLNYNFNYKLSKSIEEVVLDINTLLPKTDIGKYLNSINRVYILNLNLIKKDTKLYKKLNSSTISGIYLNKTKIIDLYTNAKTFKNKKYYKEFMSHVYMHEIGHHIDCQLNISKKYNLEFDKNFKELIADIIAFIINNRIKQYIPNTVITTNMSKRAILLQISLNDIKNLISGINNIIKSDLYGNVNN